MIHIKLDVFTLYVAQPRGGIDIRCGIMIVRTAWILPRVIGVHFTRTEGFHAIRGNFLSLFLWTWSRTFRIGKAFHRDGQPVKMRWD